MGSINSSQRRRMSVSLELGTSQEDLSTNGASREEGEHREEPQASGDVAGEGADSDTDQHDLSSILAYLIRSGQVRILSSDQGDSYSSDEDYYTDKQRPPVADPDPDVSRLKENDIYEEILLRSGRSHAFDRSHPTVAHMLYKRQIGFGCHKAFGASDRRLISTPYLPNYRTLVARYRQKAFCGTYSVDGNIFLSASQDQNIRIYDTRDDEFKLMKTIRAKDVGWSVLDTAFSPDGNYMAYSSWSDCIHLCNVHGDDDIHTALHLFPTESSFSIFSLTFSSDNREILGGANDGHLYVYDRDSNQRSLKIDAHDDDVNAVAFADRTSQILFSGGDDGLCKVWDRRTLKEDHPVPVGVMAGHHDGITYIDSKGDARYLLSNSKDQSMKLWDIRMFSSKQGVEETKKAVSRQRWDYRWQPVPKKMNKVSRISGDSSVMTYRGHSVLHTLIRCHFSPEFTTGQRYVYTGCAMGNLIIYDTLTGQIVRKLEGHRSCVRDVSWHPYDNNIVTSSIYYFNSNRASLLYLTAHQDMWDSTVLKWHYKMDMEDDALSDTEQDNEGYSTRSHIKCPKRQKLGSMCKGADKRRVRGLFD